MTESAKTYNTISIMYNSESLMHRMTKYSHHRRLHPLRLMHSLTPDVDIAEISKDYFSIYICKKYGGMAEVGTG